MAMHGLATFLTKNALKLKLLLCFLKQEDGVGQQTEMTVAQLTIILVFVNTTPKHAADGPEISLSTYHNVAEHNDLGLPGMLPIAGVVQGCIAGPMNTQLLVLPAKDTFTRLGQLPYEQEPQKVVP